jgi:uncharacterized membrane protein (UPF0136 family)
MTEVIATSTRFVSVVGWLFLAASAIGLVVAGMQTVLLLGAASGITADGRARAVALALAASSLLILFVSVAFLKRRWWARGALAAIISLGIVACLSRLLVPSAAIEPPPDAPAEYVRLLRLISIANVAAPIAVCLTLGWILWRLRSPAVRDQFR